MRFRSDQNSWRLNLKRFFTSKTRVRNADKSWFSGIISLRFSFDGLFRFRTKNDLFPGPMLFRVDVFLYPTVTQEYARGYAIACGIKKSHAAVVSGSSRKIDRER